MLPRPSQMNASPRSARPVPIVAISGLTPPATQIEAFSRPQHAPVAIAPRTTSGKGAPSRRSFWATIPQRARIAVNDRSMSPPTITPVWAAARNALYETATPRAFRLGKVRNNGVSVANTPQSAASTTERPTRSNRPEIKARRSRARNGMADARASLSSPASIDQLDRLLGAWRHARLGPWLCGPARLHRRDRLSPAGFLGISRV